MPEMSPFDLRHWKQDGQIGRVEAGIPCRLAANVRTGVDIALDERWNTDRLRRRDGFQGDARMGKDSPFDGTHVAGAQMVEHRNRCVTAIGH